MSPEIERWLEMLDGYAEPEARAVHGLELLRHTSHADAAAYYRRVGDDFTLYAQTGGQFQHEPVPELRAALTLPPHAETRPPDAGAVELELAASNGSERRAYLLLDEDGMVSGALAISGLRHTRVPPQALLVALSRSFTPEAETAVARITDVTKRKPIAS